MPPPPPNFQYKTIEKPKSFSDIPRFLREITSGFFGRMAYIVKLVWDTGHWILFVMSLISLLQGVLPIIGSYISKYLLNALQVGFGSGKTLKEFLTISPGTDNIAFLLIFTFVFSVLNNIIGQINNAVSRITGEKVTLCVKMRIMEKAKELDLAAFDMPAFYEKLENANREAGHRPIQILSSTFSVISTVISFISYLVVLLTLPGMWWTAPIIILVSFPSAIINFAYRRKNFSYIRWRSKERRQMNYYSSLLTNKDMVKEIRIFGLSDLFIGKYRQVFDIYYSGIKKLIVKETTWHIVIAVITGATNIALFGIIAFMVISGKIMIGDYSLYTGALTTIAANISTLIWTSASIYEGTLFIDNLISFVKEEKTIVPIKEIPEKIQHNIPHSIEFQNVSFSYPGTDKAVIRNVNLKFAPGETVVLVGLNGAGKTTLIKLLTRLYDPTEGRILLDGRDIRDYSVEDVYKTFGIIFQDFGKYAFTVSENIAFGDVSREATDEEIKNAAIQSNAADFISNLPDGYSTPLMRNFEKNGIELSIGQWQKLAIARAFYSDNDILILDEPTASLDPMAEQEIFNQFDRLRTNKTTIFVSHRLSSATIASKIVVLENGAVVEEGTHTELMALGGKYHELFTTQSKRYLNSEDNDTQKQ